MSEKFTEHNPDTGVRETVDLTRYETEGKIGVYHEEDVTELVDWCKNVRNQGLADQGIKKNWWPWAKLSSTQVMFLMSKGYNVFDKNLSTKALEGAVDRYYPYLKLTNKRVS